MKEYRSTIRSKKMNRSAMIELLAEKDISKITVVDIIGKADLSRNTFYAHYQDIYAVVEELEDDFLSEMNRCLDEAVHNREFFDPLPLLRKFQHFVEDSVETNRLLLANQNAAAFCRKNKAGFYQKSYGKSANHWGKGQRRVLNFSGMCCRRFCQLISKKFEQRIDIDFGRDHIRNQSDIHMGFEKIYVIMRLEG